MTTTQICTGCNGTNRGTHACAGSARIHGGVGPQLASLRSQLEDARALLAVMVTPEEHAAVVQERDDLRVQRDELLRVVEGKEPVAACAKHYSYVAMGEREAWSCVLPKGHSGQCDYLNRRATP